MRWLSILLVIFPFLSGAVTLEGHLESIPSEAGMEVRGRPPRLPPRSRLPADKEQGAGKQDGVGSGTGKKQADVTLPATGSKYRLSSVDVWRKPLVMENGRIKSYEPDSKTPPRLIENKGWDRRS